MLIVESAKCEIVACGTKMSLNVIRKLGMRGESEEKKSVASAKRVDECILRKLQKK